MLLSASALDRVEHSETAPNLERNGMVDREQTSRVSFRLSATLKPAQACE